MLIVLKIIAYDQCRPKRRPPSPPNPLARAKCLDGHPVAKNDVARPPHRSPADRLRPLIEKIDQTAKASTGQAALVFTDLRDRVRAYLHWVSSLRSVCAWCENVYGYLGAKDEAAKAAFEKNLQAAIDFELANIRGLIELLETTKSEVLVLSGVAENTYFYGENLVQHLKTKLRLTEKYRHHKPRIDPDIFWRPIPGTEWPKGWSASASTPQ